MQPLTGAGVTEAQARAHLTDASSVHYDRGAEILAADLTVVEDISGDLLGGTISRSMRADIHGTCSLVLARDFNYGAQLIRPYMTLTAGGVTSKWYEGAYVGRKPTSTYGDSLPSNAVDGSDRLFLLNRPVGNSYTVAAGTGVLAAVRQAIIDAGLPASTVLLDGTASSSTLPLVKLWPLIADTTTTTPAVTAADAVTSGSANGTTWLQIVNELLGMVNYRGLWCDWNGLFRSESYATPATRPVEFAHNFDDALHAIVARQRSSVQDYSAVPNVWIFQQTNIVSATTTTDAYGNTVESPPPEPVKGAGQYTVENPDDGPASINARGGLRFPVVVQLDAADQASLVSQGDTRVAADKRVTKVLTVTTSPFPAAWHWDVYTYADQEMGGLVKVQSASWQLDLGSGNSLPADMQNSWEVVA